MGFPRLGRKLAQAMQEQPAVNPVWVGSRPAKEGNPHASSFRQPKVRLRIVELQSEVASKLSADAALTVELHMEKLRELRDRAASLNHMSAAINAERLRGELWGFYVKQIATGDAGEVRSHDGRGAEGFCLRQ
jgi:hypothetical protein